jgi:hypothetical protein
VGRLQLDFWLAELSHLRQCHILQLVLHCGRRRVLEHVFPREESDEEGVSFIEHCHPPNLNRLVALGQLVYVAN